MREKMIQKIIRVPKEIIKAVNDDTLAVFIGAGVSRIVGCMGWGSLAKNLINLCFTLKKEEGSTCINFKEKINLSSNRDHKKIITICQSILELNKHEEAFFKELERSLTPCDEFLKRQNIYEEISGLRGLFITTNADQIFDSRFNPENIIYKPDEINPEYINRNYLYRIHGSIIDRESLVFTVPQYIRRYNDPNFRKFLEEIFDKYTVLFLGYGLTEFELLDFLITKFDKNENIVQKHFIMLPYYKGEENILQYDKYYYEKIGINVLGYELDEKGYSQLYDILKKWNIEVNQISAYLPKSFDIIDRAVQEYEDTKTTDILQLIKNDKPQKNHFFEKLAQSDKAPLWMELLYNNDYFNPENNPAPSEVPDKQGFYTIEKWNVLEYLLNVAKILEKNPDKKITSLLLEIVNSIINYRDKDDERIDNTTTDRYILKIIFLLPNEMITDAHIKWLGESIQTKWRASTFHAEIGYIVLPKFLNSSEKNKTLLLLDEILNFKKSERPVSDEFESIIDKYWLRKALTRHKETIAKVCGVDAAQVAIQKMKLLLTEDDSGFFYMWIPTIEDHPQSRFPDKYETQLVHFVRDILAFSEAGVVKPIVEELLKETHPIFRRLAVHLIDVHYSELNEIFWDFKENPLDDYELEHELHELLKNNCSEFTKDQLDKALQWIETKQYSISDEIKDDESKVEKAIAYKKKEWLIAMLDSDNPAIKEAFQRYGEINPAKSKYPGLRTWSEEFVGDVSPIGAEELLKKSNMEITVFLKEFRAKDVWGSPSQEGLSTAFKTCVLGDPQRFSEGIDTFKDIPPVYIHSLISGFSDAWREKKDFSWETVFNFIEQLIKTDKYWQEESKNQRADYRNWIISRILELIKEGTKSDNNAFDPSLLLQAEKILFLIADKIDSSFQDRHNLYSAMILFSLRYARLYKKDEKERWVETIKEYFDRHVNLKLNPTKEFYHVLGEYLLKLIYLDEQWVNDNINRMFPSDNEKYWETSFSYHVLNTNKVYKEIYFMLKEAGIWQKAIGYDFEDGHVTEHMIQHFCISYIEGWEKLDDSKSLIKTILERHNAQELNEIIRFIGTFKQNITEEKLIRAKELWKVLYDILKEKQTETEYKRLISNLSRWISLLDKIDQETFEWLKFSARYVEVNYNSPRFIENLSRLVKANQEEVGTIYLEILNSNVYPNFDEKDIKNIVKSLYESGQKECAHKICVLYMSQGNSLLKPIYEQYHNV